MLSSIALFFQLNYKNHWEVTLSRTVDKTSLIQTTMLIKKQAKLKSIRYSVPIEKIDPIILIREINDLIASAMINYLSNEDILYSGLGKSKEENLLRKEIYELIVQNDNSDKIDVLKENLNKFIVDTNSLTRDMIRMQYELEPTYNMEIYNFKIIEIKKVAGYDYVKIIKIISINFVVSIFFIFIFYLRKTINLF